MITLILAGMLVIGLVSLARLGFSFTPKLTIPTLHWWGHPMRNSLKAYLAKQIPNTDFMIHYHIGGGLMGETDLRLRGDGSYELWTTATTRRKRKSYSGQVETSQVEQVVQDMLAAKLWQARHLYARPALDDAEAIISVEAGEQKKQVLLWVSEIRESPLFFRCGSNWKP
ncbi:MAG: hypothetical protein ACPGWR_13845 [Ardenticatenaceae bacterium]